MQQCVYGGQRGYVLENSALRAVVLPGLGGKMASFYHKARAFELLFQNPKGQYEEASLYDDFAAFDASGYDDAFPTIDACRVSVGDEVVEYPDHGEIWSGGCEAKVLAHNKLRLTYESRVLPCTYVRTMEMDEAGLSIHHSIHNHGTAPFEWLYAMHCLIRCEADMKLLFPEGTALVETVMDSPRLGPAGTIHPFPQTTDVKGHPTALDSVLPEQACAMDKYYVKGKVSEGFCGAYYPQSGARFEVRYDEKKLPYLGLWLTAGGFRGDYNCALEPSNGYYDSIDTARANGAVCVLAPGETAAFAIHMSIR